ncbi:hypothetical protein D5085_13075 [Ectothiorhodospiraceae bacterium BW-2]|nr:hypothetical protein D5085_13075 [Ectothiorhodospiraceae bacterium BW-2]
MDSHSLLAPNRLIFCEKRWQLIAFLLAAAVLLTFFWAFFILAHYLEEYNIEDYSINMVDGGMGGMVNMANRSSMSLQALVTPAVVTLVRQDTPNMPLASGVIVHPEGFILTTAHSIDKIARIGVLVQAADGVKRYKTEVVKTHKTHDLALLKIVTNDKFLFLKLADTTQLTANTQLHAFGKSANGVVMARSGVLQQHGVSLTVGRQTISHLLTTTVPFVAQHSGGPMVTEKARLAGVNIVVQQGEGLAGYTIPSHVIVAHFSDVLTFHGLNRPVQSKVDPALPQADTNGVAAAWWQQAREQEAAPEQLLNRALNPDLAAMNVAAADSKQVDKNAQVNHIGSAGDEVTLLDLEQESSFELWGYKLDAMFALSLLGVAGGMLGALMPMGGSLLVVTGMMMLFGYGLYMIRPAIYVVNLFTYGISAHHYWKRGLVMRERLLPLLPWILFGVVIGFFIGHHLFDHVVGIMLGGFALVLAALALYDTYNRCPPQQPVVELPDSSREAKLEQFINSSGLTTEREQQQRGTWLDHAIMGGPMGLLTGILSVGGGITEEHYQRRHEGLAKENAVANTVVMVFVASLVAALVSFSYGSSIGAFSWQTPLTLAMILIPSTYAGALLGVRWFGGIPREIQRWLFALIMVMIALTMFFAQ